MPGPTLYAEVGDVLVVHFRNADTKLDQAVTMHPHGVRYNPEYDGAYLGKYTRAGGFVAPGEEFTYFWECVPGAAGAWPYHDHGPNHTLNTSRGLFGAIVINERGAKIPDVNYTLMLHQLTPPITGLNRAFQCINGRAFAGNTPTLKAKVGQDVAIHVFGMDSTSTTSTCTGTAGATPAGAHRHHHGRTERDHHRPLHRGQPGPLALPLPRLLPSGRGDGGLVRRRRLIRR